MGRKQNITIQGNGNTIATSPGGTRTITTADGNTVTTDPGADNIAVINGRVYVNGREQ
ncbi:hypothetical protein [Actinocrinis sp.]|uniref:hypothetical protein n=1 Tax=Actinocrinis sp. TaxID=1920516 RepID=UPI002D59B702|nr:hypothetical protein [Actinocrinis sp.]HZP54620.1 hypothetical protein [Actinocrinis sp.]